MEPITGSMLSLKGVLAVVGVVLASISGYALVSEETQVGETNFLVPDSHPTSDFRDSILSRSADVNNTITNMLNGDVEINKAISCISYEKTFSKDQTALTPSDMKINKAYMGYLGAASDVVTAYTYESTDLQDKIVVMNEKKNLI